MMPRRVVITLLAVLTTGLVAGGCGQSTDMSPKEAADFKGGSHGPMTDSKKKAMNDFMDNFRKMHPEQAQGAPKH